MKSHRSRITPKSGWGVVMLALGMLVLAFATGVQAEPQYAMDCKGCHDMPPKDSKGAGATKKDPFTGAVPGDHETHATGLASSCEICHGSPAPTSNSHAAFKKSINMNPAMGYNRNPGFLNQTSVPPNPLGTCSNVSCHGDGKGGGVRSTPAWGSAYFSGTGDCNRCHGVAPATGNHPTGATKHAQYYGTGVSSCYPCHSEHDKDAKPFAHASSSRPVQVKLAGAGNFDGTKCSNVTCHSNGKGNMVDANWGASFPADCSGCHGNATSNTLSGKHAKHVNNAALGNNGTNNGYLCSACHADTVLSNTSIKNPGTGKHVNSMINYSGLYAGRGGATCNTVYCHSDGRGTFKAISSNGWNRTTAMYCNSCHGSDASPDFVSVAGEPNYATGTKGPNSHKSHVKAAGATTCVYCHTGVVNTNGTTLTGTNHTDGSIQVQQDVADGKTFGWNGGSKGCSNISCHGDGIVAVTGNSATWGSPLTCYGCHGDDAATLTTGSHVNHLNMANITCNACHNSTASDNSTISNSALHIDANTEVAGSKITSYAKATTKNCATACHYSSTPTWGSASTGTCGTCHLALSGTSGGLIGSTSGSAAHVAHFSGKAYGPKLNPADGNSCAVCHVYPSEKAASHADGTVQLVGGFSKNGLCNDCHKQNTDWFAGRDGANWCQSCHTHTGPAGAGLSVIGVVAPDKTLDATQGHGAWNSTKCTDCHNRDADHISGVLGDNDRLLVGSRSDITNATCNVCHNNDTKVTSRTLNMQTHDAPRNGSTSLSGQTCVACHDPHGTANGYMVRETINGTTVSYSGSNLANTQGTGICQVCHNQTKFFKAGQNELNHFTTNCLECHLHNSPSGVAFAPKMDCDSCHGYPPMPRNVAGLTFGTQGNWSSAKYEDYSGGGGAHAVAGHILKTAKASEGWANCTICHADAAGKHDTTTPVRNHVDNVTVTMDQKYRFSNDYMAIYTSAQLVNGGSNKSGSCFNVSCHFRPSKPWSNER